MKRMKNRIVMPARAGRLRRLGQDGFRSAPIVRRLWSFARWAAPSVAVFLLFLSWAGCGGDAETKVDDTTPPAAGFVDEDAQRERSLRFLRYASRDLSALGPMNIIAYLERQRLDPSFKVPDRLVPVNQFDASFEKMATLRDTRDFDALYLLNLLLGYGNDPALAPGLKEKIEQSFLSFKFWFTDPTPDGLRDDAWYWSENHELAFCAGSNCALASASASGTPMCTTRRMLRHCSPSSSLPRIPVSVIAPLPSWIRFCSTWRCTRFAAPLV